MMSHQITIFRMKVMIKKNGQLKTVLCSVGNLVVRAKDPDLAFMNRVVPNIRAHLVSGRIGIRFDMPDILPNLYSVQPYQS